jgi:O-antigen ligase
MFWNNDYVYYGLKSLEQKLVYLFFPMIILSSPFKIEVFKIINYWTKITVIILFFFSFRYVILYYNNITNYLNGIDVWDMGYSFSRSIADNHAPALNLIISFSTVSALYVFLKEGKRKKILNFSVYIFLFVFVLIINTRMSVSCMVLGSFFVFLYECKNFFTAKKSIGISIILLFLICGFIYIFPYTIEKYTTNSFKNMDKIGKLDEVENPEAEVYNSMVSRISMWKSAWELSQRNFWLGVGASDGKRKLIEYYYETDQMFLYKYKFPVHNQYLDYLVRFGIIGLVLLGIFILAPLYIGLKLKNSLIIYFSSSFILSNLTDDFLIRFDGIVFSCLIICFSGYYFLQFQNRYSLKN